MKFFSGARGSRAPRSAALAPGAEAQLRDFMLIAAAAIMLAALLVLDERAPALLPLRLLLGALYVLYLPGYALVAALFPQPGSIGRLERRLLAIGLSVACVALLALILDMLPWRIQPWSIFAAETAVIAIGLGAAIWRRARLRLSSNLPTAHAAALRPWWLNLPPPERRLHALIAAALLCAGLATAAILVVASPQEFMTEFYLLGAEGRAELYPYQVTTADELVATVGVANHERAEHVYRIELWAHATRHGGSSVRLADLPPVLLPVGEQLEQTVRWRMPTAGSDQRVELLLFMDDAQTPYRRLRLWVNVDPPGLP